MHLETGGLLNDIFLRSRKHAVFCDWGGGGVRHVEQVDLGVLGGVKSNNLMNRFLRVKLEG
jgi:hypothetical protein